MGANCNATPPLLKAIFLDYRFDLTNSDPPHQNFMDAICHVTPVLNDILDLCRFDLMYLTPAHQNFTGAFCHVTPVLNDILDLCRYDLTYLTPPLKFHRCNLLRYTCVKWYFRSMQIWLDIFDPPSTKILWMHFIMLHHSRSTNQHPATLDTTKTTCYRSAAQCWKTFLVVASHKHVTVIFSLTK